MKLLLQMMIWVSLFAVSACSAHFPKHPYDTATARAAYGDTSPAYKSHKKKNQRVKKKVRKAAERDHAKNDGLYGHRRPY